MDIHELKKLRRRLDWFVSRFEGCVKTEPSRKHFRTYLNGQLGPLERKSVEPIALDAGVPPRTLQEFLSAHRWDDGAVGRRLRELVIRDHASPDGIAVIDETSFPKKGDKTPGVQRQHCGASGKTDNCVVTVHVGYVAGDFHTLIDGDLYLPEESWSDDRARCRAAGIPDDVVYRAKWRIALDLLRRDLDEGIPMSWLTADEGYGRCREFRETVASWGLAHIVEIPASLTGWTRKPAMEPAGTVSGTRTLTKPRVATGEREARTVSSLWRRGGPSWKRYQIKQTDNGPLVWEVRETSFFGNNNGIPGREERLLVAREVITGDIKYFLTNGLTVPLKDLLVVAFSRWRIERLFEDGKGEVGFDHFEVRCYRSLMRHLVLTNLSLYFLCEETERLSKKKSVVEPCASEGCRGGAAGSEDVVA